MPRVLMSLILAATGAAGFLVSFALLHAGVTRMWLRYPFAVLAAYAVFLLLALALIVAGVLASLYVVYAAPTLLAELLV